MATGLSVFSSSMLPPRTSTSTLDSMTSGSSRSPSPYGQAHNIQLINTIPGGLPRSSAPTRQRLLYVAASLSIHLTNADLPHAFLGRFSLFLRGADVAPRWVEADVIKPIIGATQRVKDVLALHKDFAIHGEVHEDGTDMLLVSHSCGIYVRLSVGAIPSLKKKTDLISAHLDASQPSVVLPCLTPARQFLETVIIASSMNAKVEDLQDLVWMKDNLKMDMMNDPTTLKKTWEDGRLGKLIDNWPAMKSVFVDLGLVVDGAEVRSTVHSTLNRSRSKYGH